MKSKVVPLFEEFLTTKNGERVCLQYCRYEYGDGSQDTAFRTIRRGKSGALKAQRGQAGVKTLEDLEKLIAAAKKAGWGLYKGTMD